YRSDVWPQLLETMKRDKKARGSMLRMVLLTDIGQPSTVEIPDASILHTAYQEVGETSPTLALPTELGCAGARSDGSRGPGVLELPSGAPVCPPLGHGTSARRLRSPVGDHD